MKYFSRNANLFSSTAEEAQPYSFLLEDEKEIKFNRNQIFNFHWKEFLRK